MDINIIQQYIVPIIFVTCLIVGDIIKTSIPKIDNKHIPLILGVLGVVLSVWINMAFTPTVLVEGLASAWASTGAYELLKNYNVGGLVKKLFNKE